MSPQYERLNHWIDQLQANQHPELEPGDDPAEGELLATASSWAAQRPGADEPDPAFLAQLRGQLFADAAPPVDGGTPDAGTPQRPPDPLPIPAIARASSGPTPLPPAGPAPATFEQRVVAPSRLMERRLSRRSVLSGLGAAAAGLVAGLGLQGFFTQQTVAAAQAAASAAEDRLKDYEDIYEDRDAPAGPLPDGQGKWFAVAQLNEVQIGEAIPVTMGAVKGYLVRESDTKFNALSGVCTHLGCDLGWTTKTHTFVCGCHGSSFDATGAAMTGPALYRVPLRHLPVFSWKVQEGIVYVLA